LRAPEAELALAGESPTREIRALAESGEAVRLLGHVPDAASIVRSSAVSLVPIRVGSGVRLKILEAFANERPVVSTSIGCEGLPVRHGEHLLVADTAESFANATVSILTDPGLASAMAKRGRALVEELLGWERVIESAERILSLD
jgi:glycosyltransferase involved in cell wall biosynthesis